MAQVGPQFQIGPAQQQLLDTIVEKFLEQNAIHNLSAFRTKEACTTGNIDDSLAALAIPELQNLPPGAQVLDIGTGGGFPLLPLAALLPLIAFTGLDSIQKKITAIRTVVEACGIQNVFLLAGRAEEYGRMAEHREQYDIVTARAVAELPVLLEYCSPFVKPGGYLLLWKSMNMEEEMQRSLLARAELQCHFVRSHSYDLGQNWGKRQILIFQKRNALSPTYPREIGVPKANPLL